MILLCGSSVVNRLSQHLAWVVQVVRDVQVVRAVHVGQVVQVVVEDLKVGPTGRKSVVHSQPAPRRRSSPHHRHRAVGDHAEHGVVVHAVGVVQQKDLVQRDLLVRVVEILLNVVGVQGHSKR